MREALRQELWVLTLPVQSSHDEVNFLPFLQGTVKILALLARRPRHLPNLVLLPLPMPGGSTPLTVSVLRGVVLFTPRHEGVDLMLA